MTKSATPNPTPKTASDGAASRGDCIAARQRPAPCITSSFQAECVVLTHMLREERPDIPVLFLDTFHHFPQTLAYRDELTERWKLESDQPRAKEPQVGLWQREHAGVLRAPQGGAAVHRARRLRHLVHRAAADQSPSRANLKEVEPFQLPSGRRFARRADCRLDCARRLEIREGHDIPLLPLYELGLHEHRLRAVHHAAARSQ